MDIVNEVPHLEVCNFVKNCMLLMTPGPFMKSVRWTEVQMELKCHEFYPGCSQQTKNITFVSSATYCVKGGNCM